MTAWPLTAAHAQESPLQPRDIRVGQDVTGHLADGVFRDTYRFRLAALERVAVSVLPAGDAALGVSVLDPAGTPLVEVAHTAPGVPWTWIGQLGLGGYLVAVQSAGDGAVDYRLGIERLDPFAISQDQEPNRSPAEARPIPPFLTVEGDRDGDTDVDWYRFGPLTEPAPLTLTATGAPAAIRVTDGARTYPTLTDDTGTRLRTAVLPTGRELYLEVTPTGPYRIHVDGGVPVPAGRPIPARLLEAEVYLASDPSPVAAGRSSPQRLPVTLLVLNEGRDPRQLTVDARTSDDAWSVVIGRPTIELGGSATVEVPVVIVVPPFAVPDVTVRATIRLQAADGTQATGFVDVTPSVDAAPLQE